MENSIQYLKGVGEKRARLLKKLGVDSVDALLRFYPRTYEDWSRPGRIFDNNLDKSVCIKAKIITQVEEKKTRKGLSLFGFSVSDGEGQMRVTLFNQKYLAGKLHHGSEYLFFGKMQGNPFYREMQSPEIREVNYQYIRPVYRACEGLPSSITEKLTSEALKNIPEDPIPEEVLQRHKLCSLEYALRNIHFPASFDAQKRAEQRLIFEELFLLQTGLELKRSANNRENGIKMRTDFSDEFSGTLPFTLTTAQKRVISECMTDMTGGRCMNRLLQGDVGSGKTAVAASLIYCCTKNGYQAALMAPTEILAEQHFSTLKKMLGSTINVRLLTGSVKKSEKERIKAELAAGDADVVVGTHALIVDDVCFAGLGLVITDEQHRFGVAQREKLTAKGAHPHTLVMSATPIPRTLAMIIYGDLDISVIDEMPHGRQPVESYAVGSGLHQRIYNFLKKHIDSGEQAYIICPLVEESDSTLISAGELAKQLKDREFRDYNVGILHGKLRPAEKDSVMRSFSSGETQLLVATTVVEVGVDVPNATVMVIENAEMFGLSQLHQLRGRIGRGNLKSTCIFVSDDKNETAQSRLRTMCSTTDGFKIADEDLKTRGPGDFLGHRQHGLPELAIADMAADIEVFRKAGAEAKELTKIDPKLEKHPKLLQAVEKMFRSAYQL